MTFCCLCAAVAGAAWRLLGPRRRPASSNHIPYEVVLKVPSMRKGIEGKSKGGSAPACRGDNNRPTVTGNEKREGVIMRLVLALCALLERSVWESHFSFLLRAACGLLCTAAL